MKNSRFFRNGSLLSLTILMLAGCSTPVSLDPPSQPPASSGGKTVLTIGAGSTPTVKTILPTAPAITEYKLSADSGSGFQTVAAFSTVPATASINQGTYDFKLEATDGSGKVVLAQVQLGVVVGEPSLNLNFTLSPVTGGAGDILVTVSWPAAVAVDSADTVFGPLGGTQTGAAAVIASNSVTFTQSAVASGNYLLTIHLKDSGGIVLDTVIEVVRVSQNLLSTKTINLTATDFNAPPTPPSLVAATPTGNQVNVNWTDSSTNETGFSVERSADNGTTWTLLTTTLLLPGTTSLADPNATAGGTFLYRVKALNTFGSSPATVSASITQFPILYDGNGSTGGAVPTDTTRYVQGAVVPVRANPGNLVKTGFALGGWNTSPDGLGTSYGLAAASFPLNTVGVTLYAIWIPTNLNFASLGNDISITGGSFSNIVVIIPNGVTSIASAAFDSSSITGVVIPPTVTSIGAAAFHHAFQLTSIVIPRSVTTIGQFVFELCSSLTNISVDPANPNFQSVDGALLDKAGTTLIAVPCAHTGTFTIPSGVTTIGGSAFNQCHDLSAVSIPDSVTSIGALAFTLCGNLNTIVIPSNVTTIGLFAFSGCSGLSSVTVLAVSPPALPAGSNAFTNTDANLLIHVPSASLAAYKAAVGWSDFASKIVSP